MTGHSGVRNDKEIFLVGFCIWYTLKDSGKWVGEEEGGDELHYNNLATVIVRRQRRAIFSHSSTEAPVAELAYWNAILPLAYYIFRGLGPWSSLRMLM